jgi:hypothetical protein
MATKKEYARQRLTGDKFYGGARVQRSTITQLTHHGAKAQAT